MKTIATLTLLTAAALLAACGSGGTVAGTSSTSASAPAPASSSASPTTSMTCTDYQLTASHLPTYVHYIALNVGTTNDSSTYYPELDEAMSVLTSMTPTCAPAAVAPVAALAASVETLESATKPGTDAATVAADKAALATVRAAGIAAWTAMGMPTAGWENRPEDSR